MPRTRTVRALSARGFILVKDMNTQSKFQTSLQYAKRNIIPLATTIIPQFTTGTSRLLKDVTAKAFGSFGAHRLVSFIKADGEEDTAEYKKLVELLQKATAMVPVAEIKELCAGLNICSTIFVMFLKNFSGPEVENIISTTEEIPGVKEIHEFLKAKGINVDLRYVAMFIIWLVTGLS